MGDRIAARKRMIAAEVPVVPGTKEQPLQSAEEALRVCEEIGFPVMLKASMGGGGKGMRLIHEKGEVVEAYHTARSESLSSFGDDTVYIEKLVEEPRHKNPRYWEITMVMSFIYLTGNVRFNVVTRKS